MTLSIFDTGDIAPVLDPHETITRRLTPSHLRPSAARRPKASTTGAEERRSFAVLGDSGDFPILNVADLAAAERVRPETTARIVITAPVAEPVRPWFYRGQRRATRSYLLLFAATWDGAREYDWRTAR